MSVVTFSRDIIAVLVVAGVSTAILAFLLDRIRLHVKFFLILAFLILLYSLARSCTCRRWCWCWPLGWPSTTPSYS